MRMKSGCEIKYPDDSTVPFYPVKFSFPSHLHFHHGRNKKIIVSGIYFVQWHALKDITLHVYIEEQIAPFNFHVLSLQHTISVALILVNITQFFSPLLRLLHLHSKAYVLKVKRTNDYGERRQTSDEDDGFVSDINNNE